MKNVLIGIIIILLILLVGQLIYFKNDKNIQNNNKNNIVNEITRNNMYEENSEDVITEIIQPDNIATLSQVYKGKLKLLPLEKEFYTFIESSVKEIYNATSGKSINQVSQMYDLREQAINNMNIYSKEDFEGIAKEILKVGGTKGITYLSSNIDMESYNNNENGYATFNITFTYTNMKQINMKVYLANENNTLPNIKFGKQN